MRKNANNKIEFLDALLFNFATRLKNIANTLVQSSKNKASIDTQVNKLKDLDREMAEEYDKRSCDLKQRLTRKKYATQYNQLRQELNTIVSNAVVLLRGAAPEALAKILHAGASS